MKITLSQQNDAVHFQAKNEDGQTVDFDGTADIGGEGKGMRPMEVLLSSVAACSVFDITTILKKQRQPVEHIDIEVTGTRPAEGAPKPFKAIHLHFALTGTLEESKVARAVQLSVEKYCSVAESLDKTIRITYEFEIRPSA